jgi:hypothetical protein
MVVAALGARPLGLGLSLLAGVLAALALLVGRFGPPLARGLGRLQPSDTLEDFGATLVEALGKVGALAEPLGPAAVRIMPQSDGYYRCYLAGATLADSRLFADALDELLAPLAAPRYIIPRQVVALPHSWLDALWLLLPRRTDRYGRGVYHAIPAVLSTNHERAEAFADAWNRHVSPGRPLYCQRPEAQAILEVQRGADPFAVTTQMRLLWT